VSTGKLLAIIEKQKLQIEKLQESQAEFHQRLFENQSQFQQKLDRMEDLQVTWSSAIFSFLHTFLSPFFILHSAHCIEFDVQFPN
jgi:hypothetical protein